MSRISRCFHELGAWVKTLFCACHKKKHEHCAVARKRVLIIIPHDKSWWAINVVQQFVSTLRELMGYAQAPHIDIVPLQSRLDVLHTLLMSLSTEPRYDLVMTVGSWVSREVRDFFDGNSCPIPHVFCGVIDPAGIGLVDSLDVPGRLVSGVAAIPFDFNAQLSMLKALQPNLSTIAVVHTAEACSDQVASLIHRQLQLFERACTQHKITLIPVPARCIEEVQNVLYALRPEPQTAMICALNDVFVSAHIEALVDICKHIGIPLCTNELSSVYHGAAIGFGESGGVYGTYGASLAYDVLVNKRDLRMVPVMMPQVERSMRYNYDAMIAQGMVVGESTLHLLNMVSVFFHSR